MQHAKLSKTSKNFTRPYKTFLGILEKYLTISLNLTKNSGNSTKIYKQILSQYTREAYGHKERKGHPQTA